MSGHTPGPWIFEPHGAYKSDLLGEDWPVGYISTARPPVPIFVLGEILARPMTEVMANARLIAACPTMFDYIRQKADAGDTDARQIVEAISAKS